MYIRGAVRYRDSICQDTVDCEKKQHQNPFFPQFNHFTNCIPPYSLQDKKGKQLKKHTLKRFLSSIRFLLTPIFSNRCFHSLTGIAYLQVNQRYSTLRRIVQFFSPLVRRQLDDEAITPLWRQRNTRKQISEAHQECDRSLSRFLKIIGVPLSIKIQ